MSKKGRMELRVDDGFVAVVTELSQRTHKSKAEVLRDAVNLYYRAVEEWEKNKKGIVFEAIEEAPAMASTIKEPCLA